MTEAEKIEFINAIAGETINSTLSTAMLKKAKYAIRNRMYPFDLPKADGSAITFVVPEKYESLQCELALRYIDRMGAEGEQLHIENGIDRHYGSINEEDLLKEVMQVVV